MPHDKISWQISTRNLSTFFYIELGNPLSRSGFHCGYFALKGDAPMNAFEKSEAIKASLRKGFQDGSSKMAKRRCYGYDVASDGTLVINSEEAKVVTWIFEQYKAGKSLGKIAAGLEQQGILSPTGKPKWNREAIDKLLSNEKYTGRVLLQKTISTGAVQIENDGLMDRYLYSDAHEAIISDELFMKIQEEKQHRAKSVDNKFVMQQIFWYDIIEKY